MWNYAFGVRESAAGLHGGQGQRLGDAWDQSGLEGERVWMAATLHRKRGEAPL